VSLAQLPPAAPILAPDRLEVACRRAVVTAALADLDRPVAPAAVADRAFAHVFGGAWTGWSAPCVPSTLMVALAEAERRLARDPAAAAALAGLVARAWAAPPSSRARYYVLAMAPALLGDAAARDVP
jgi:hypothetical protein